MDSTVTRRTFVKSAAAVGVATTLASSRAYGANDRIRLAFIGVGNRGGQLIQATLPHKDAEIVALCDVYKPFLDQWNEKLGGNIPTFADFRRILEAKDVDAVVIATPDHWHAIQTIDACRAGKDVYVEKPLSMTIWEGRRMVDVARETNTVVQVGVHRRSGALYSKLADDVKNGLIGKVTVARCYHVSDMWPNGIGKSPDTEPPADLDWNMWLGPRAEHAYRDTIAPYKFRWWKSYSSQVANQGVHFFDLIRWMLDERAPVSTSAHGGRYAIDDDRDIPDTMEVVHELPSGSLAIFGQYEASGTAVLKRGYVELRGTLGTLYMDDRGYEIDPAKGGQFQDPKPRMEPVKVEDDGSNANLTEQHMRNFLDCVRRRQMPAGDVEIGHRSTTFSHLANIALATRSRIDWDADQERVTNNEEANKLLHYEYREPWKLG